eukprot:3660373-Pyramimonas_sp.AAC.1
MEATELRPCTPWPNGAQPVAERRAQQWSSGANLAPEHFSNFSVGAEKAFGMFRNLVQTLFLAAEL